MWPQITPNHNNDNYGNIGNKSGTKLGSCVKFIIWIDQQYSALMRSINDIKIQYSNKKIKVMAPFSVMTLAIKVIGELKNVLFGLHC